MPTFGNSSTGIECLTSRRPCRVRPRASVCLTSADQLSTDDKSLRFALLIVGLIFLVGLYPLTVLWPAGFMWEPRQSEYEQMIIGVYAVLGIFLIMASRNPAKHTSLIWFTVWSSLAHGLIMLWQAIADPGERANLLGDVPALILIAVLLGVLMLQARPDDSAGPAGTS